MGEDRRAVLLAGLARSRATGGPWLACAAGVRAAGDPGATAGDTVLGYGPSPGPASATDLGVLADLALGAGVRAVLGLDRRLATVSLTLQLHEALPAAADLRVRAARASSPGEELAVATGSVLSPAGQVGSCSAVFAPQARGLAPMPWEVPQDGSPALPGDLEPSSDELLAVDSASGTRAHGHSVVEAALLGATTQDADAAVRLQPTALLANRGGVVQGGVLLGLSVLAAHRAVPAPAELRTAHVEFVAPAVLGEAVTARCELLRPGRRTQLLRTDLHQGGRLVTTTTVLLRVLS